MQETERINDRRIDSRRSARPRAVIELLPLALRRHALERGDQTALAFYSGRGEIADRCAFADLDRRARAIAAALQSESEPGTRVVLLCRPGIDFLTGFMGCQYAAMVAVPVQPPAGMPLRSGGQPGKARKRMLDQLDRSAVIAEDADARIVLTTSALAAHLGDMGEMAPTLTSARWISVDQVGDELADAWRQPAWAPTDLSLLQYTSGSTSRPKGVAVAHEHLVANAEALWRLVDPDPARDLCASWLPPTHDMGLIGTLLQQIFLGMTQIQIAPLTFLKRPLSWLRLISESGATLTAAPNFAFDLCVDRSSPEERQEIDLTSLRAVVVGAEPIRAATMNRFIRAFEPSGLRADALFPCYGLAESTLIVTGRQGVRSVCFDREALRFGLAEPVADPAGDALPLVSCGRPVGDAEVRIVDPESLEICPEDRIGEVWVSSSHVAAGYFGQPEASERIFGARLEELPERSFLRTGDAGVLHRGEIFITGRYKEVMIFGGANHYPHDIEQTAAGAHPALRPDRLVAFSVDDDGEEQLIVGAELRGVPRDEWPEIGGDLRRAVLTQHGLRVHAVVAVSAGSLAKTTSGKPRRFLARERYRSGLLGEVL